MPVIERLRTRKDLLLLLLFAPGVGEDVNEPIVGRTRLMKVVFLAQKELLPSLGSADQFDEDNAYKFFAWNFGPFSYQVYDDITFFVLRELVTTAPREEEGSDADFSEWDLWVSSFAPYTRDEAEEERLQPDRGAIEFALTEKGCRFAQEIYSSLSSKQASMLKHFKARLQKAPLAALLRYVYEKYPDTTGNSIIKDRVLR